MSFSPSSSVFEAHLQEPSTLENQYLQWTPFHKIMNRKIIINHFQNQIFDAKTRLQEKISKNLKYLKKVTW